GPPPPLLRRGAGDAAGNDQAGRRRPARAAARGLRACRRGERLVGHQCRSSRAAARRHSRRPDCRAALPLRRGVRPRRGGAAVAGAGNGRCGSGGRIRARTMTLGDLVVRHQIVISAGSGGVGKTTVAASLALWGALEGRRAVVLTIDPARRLATSLGLESLGSGERTISAEVFRAQGLAPRGTLAAMMLDQKGAWDALVERHAPPEARDRILTNRFYQHLSQSFAGSYEYMAIEQLCALAESGRYDLIVVDTPPTRHALDFLEAPRRIADFLDRKIIKWFVRPYFSAGWSALRAMNRTAGFLLRRVEIGPEDVEQVADTVARIVGAPEARELAANFVDYQVLARGESLRIEQFRAGLARGVPVVYVPNFARDVHDLASLAGMHAHL